MCFLFLFVGGIGAGSVSAQADALTKIMNNTVGGVAEQAFKNIRDDLFGEGPVPQGRFSVAEYKGSFDSSIATNTSIRQYLLRVTNFFLAFVGLLATIMLIYGGFLYITTGADDGAEKGKKIVLYAAIGILLILLSFALVNTLITQAPRGGQDPLGGSVSQDDADMSEIIDENTGKPIVSVDSNMITATADGLIEVGDSGYAISLEDAKNGIEWNFAGGPYSDILWDFGDIARSRGQNPVTHVYGTENLYTVNVVAITEDAILKGAKKVVVGGVRARATLSKLSPLVGDRITLNGTASQSVVGEISEYMWTCEVVSGDGACFEDREGDRIDVQFDAAGSYKISLTVTSTIGLTHTAGSTIEVLGVVPFASFSYSSTNNNQKPGEYRFDARASRNRKGLANGLTYTWNFDGEEHSGTNPIFVHEFSSDGDKLVTLTVSERVNGVEFVSETAETTVRGVKVFGVDFSIPQGVLRTFEAYQFEAESANATSFEWTIPSGAKVQSGNVDSRQVSLVFSEAGHYDITLRARGAGTLSDPVTKTVHVIQKSVHDMTEDELRAMLENLGFSDQEIESILEKIRAAQTEEEVEDVLEDAGVDPRLIRGSVLAIMEVVHDGQVVLSGIELERGTDGYPQGLEFLSRSYDRKGQTGADAEIDETWVVDGAIVTGGASAIPALLTEVKTYRIELRVSDSVNQNIRDTMVFVIRIKNKEPGIIGARLRLDPLKKKVEWRDALTASVINLQVDDLHIAHEPLVTLETVKNFLVELEGVDDLDGGYIQQYTFYLKEKNRTLDTKILTSPRAFFNLESFIGKKDLHFEVQVEDNDGGVTLLESTTLFSIPEFSDEDLGDTDPLHVEIHLLSPSNRIEIGDSIQLQAKAQKGPQDSFNGRDYEWSIEGSNEEFRKSDRFTHRFESGGSKDITVTVRDGDKVATDTYTVVVEGASVLDSLGDLADDMIDYLGGLGLDSDIMNRLMSGDYTREQMREILRNAGVGADVLEDVLSTLSGFHIQKRTIEDVNAQMHEIPSAFYRPRAEPLDRGLVMTDFRLGVLGFENNHQFYKFDWTVFAPDGEVTRYKDARNYQIHRPTVSGNHRFMVSIHNKTGRVDSEIEYFKVLEWSTMGLEMPEELALQMPEEKRPIPNYNPVREREIQRIVPTHTQDVVRITPLERDPIEEQFRPSAPEVQKKLEARPMVDSGASLWVSILLFLGVFFGGGFFYFSRRF